MPGHVLLLCAVACHAVLRCVMPFVMLSYYVGVLCRAVPQDPAAANLFRSLVKAIAEAEQWDRWYLGYGTQDRPWTIGTLEVRGWLWWWWCLWWW